MFVAVGLVGPAPASPGVANGEVEPGAASVFDSGFSFFSLKCVADPAGVTEGCAVLPAAGLGTCALDIVDVLDPAELGVAVVLAGIGSIRTGLLRAGVGPSVLLTVVLLLAILTTLPGTLEGSDLDSETAAGCSRCCWDGDPDATTLPFTVDEALPPTGTAVAFNVADTVGGDGVGNRPRMIPAAGVRPRQTSGSPVHSASNTTIGGQWHELIRFTQRSGMARVCCGVGVAAAEVGMADGDETTLGTAADDSISGLGTWA